MQFRKEYESQNDTLKISLYNIKHTVHTYVYAYALSLYQILKLSLRYKKNLATVKGA